MSNKELWPFVRSTISHGRPAGHSRTRMSGDTSNDLSIKWPVA